MLYAVYIERNCFSRVSLAGNTVHVVRYLLNAGARDLKTALGNTALHFVSFSSHWRWKDWPFV